MGATGSSSREGGFTSASYASFRPSLRWKKYSDELHELRRVSSILIQKVWRKHWAGIYYRRKVARAIRANGRFLLASQHHYNVTRSVVMRRWERSV